MSIWNVKYNGHDIRVENSWLSGERLFIDDELQDMKKGLGLRSVLYGKIKQSDGKDEEVRVSLGGWLTVDCHIFVDNKLVFPK